MRVLVEQEQQGPESRGGSCLQGELRVLLGAADRSWCMQESMEG